MDHVIIPRLVKIVAALIFSIMLSLHTGSVSAQDDSIIQIACGPVDDATPALYAIKAGLFRRAGLNVQISTLKNGPAVASAIAGGSLQFGAGAVMPLIAAHGHGLSFQFVAAGTMYSSAVHSGMMVVAINSPIRSGRDLNGKTIGAASLNDVNTISTLAWIDQTGGDSRTVRIVEVPYSSVAAAIDDGRIAAASILSPILEQALESGKVRVLASPKDAIAKWFLNSAWFTTAEYASTHPDIVERFARVMREASQYANAHHADTVDLLAAYTGVPPSTVERSIRPVWGTALRPQDLQPVIATAFKYKQIDRVFKAEDLLSPIAVRALAAARQ